jgi:hypothetical protein
MLDLKATFDNGKDYYNIIIDVAEKEYFMVKNAFSFARVHKALKDVYGFNYHERRFKVYSNGNNPEPEEKNIPIKYRKFTFKC